MRCSQIARNKAFQRYRRCGWDSEIFPSISNKCESQNTKINFGCSFAHWLFWRLGSRNCFLVSLVVRLIYRKFQCVEIISVLHIDNTMRSISGCLLTHGVLILGLRLLMMYSTWFEMLCIREPLCRSIKTSWKRPHSQWIPEWQKRPIQPGAYCSKWTFQDNLKFSFNTNLMRNYTRFS